MIASAGPGLVGNLCPRPSRRRVRTAALGGGGWWWAVAVVDLGAAGVGHGGGAVGVETDAPAPLMNHDQVVEGAEEDQAFQAGRAALALGRGVVDVASCGGGEASRCHAVPVPRDDGAT